MFLQQITLKTRLLITGSGIFLILIAIGIISNNFIGDAFRYNALLLKVKQIKYNDLLMRKAENDFFLYDTRNPEFFQTRKSENLQLLESSWETTVKELILLKTNRIVYKTKQTENLSNTIESFETYRKNIQQLVDLYIERGFKDFGLEGSMRDKIHQVETIINNKPNNDKMLAKMLMLRRHEKDFMIRKDVKYKDEFQKTYEEFIKMLSAGENENKLLIEKINFYKDAFFKLVEIELRIGIDSNSGFHSVLKGTSYRINLHLSLMIDQIEKEALTEIKKAILTLVIVSFILVTALLLLLYSVSKRILVSLKLVKNHIMRLGEGELPDEIKNTRDDEIGDMINSINVLTKNLKNTRQFAIEVGEGNLETQINVFNNKGDLGGSLVEMRQRLLKLADERKQNEMEANLRNWTNEGLARFNEMLRLNQDHFQQFSYQFLSKLIDYLQANLAALFEVTELDSKTILKSVSAVAYKRNKLFQSEFELGEGIVGRCAYEKCTIQLTEIPENYIKITSGLGDANPRYVIVTPLINNDSLMGVLEMASFSEFKPYQVEFLEKVCNSLAATIATIKFNLRTEELLNNTKAQSEELAQREEELKQNMEELKATQEEAARRERSITEQVELFDNVIPYLVFDRNGIIKKTSKAFSQFYPDAYNLTGKNIKNIVTELPHITSLMHFNNIAIHSRIAINGNDVIKFRLNAYPFGSSDPENYFLFPEINVNEPVSN